MVLALSLASHRIDPGSLRVWMFTNSLPYRDDRREFFLEMTSVAITQVSIHG